MERIQKNYLNGVSKIWVIYKIIYNEKSHTESSHKTKKVISKYIKITRDYQ